MSFLIRSGNVRSGAIGNAAVLSGSIGSGQIGSGHLASGLVAGLLSGSANLTSGQVTSGFIGNAAVVSGSIGSGQVSTPHFASGTTVPYGNAIMAPFKAEDMISGVRAVTINIDPSGDAVVRIAQPLSQGISNGAHWPAQGLVIDDVLSGGTVNVYFQGLVYSDRYSGNWSTNMTFNNPAWVNASGGPDTLDTLSVFSGFHMPIGYWINASGLYFNPLGLVASGSVNRGAFQSDAIQDYAIGSGQVGQFKLGDQAILSGNLRSGLITTGAQQIIDEQVTFAGETLSGGNAGSLLAVSVFNNLSGRATVIAANPADPFRRPAIGVVTKNYASGDPVQVITNGILSWGFSVNTNLGQPFFVGNSGYIEGINLPTTSGSWIQPMGIALGRGLGGNSSGTLLIQPMVWLSGMITRDLIGSGAIVSGAIASGGVAGAGLSGGSHSFMIASGSIGSFDMAVNSVTSAQIGPGAVGRPQLGSGTNAYGIQWTAITGESFSGNGINAVCLASGQLDVIVHAERQSGLRLPAVGVVIAAGASGSFTNVFSFGPVTTTNSGVIASGFHGRPLYVGSGGLIVNQSGFNAGPSSGAPFLSGSVVQQIGLAISGGIFVNPNTQIASGIVSTAQGNF